MPSFISKKQAQAKTPKNAALEREIDAEITAAFLKSARQLDQTPETQAGNLPSEPVPESASVSDADAYKGCGPVPQGLDFIVNNYISSIEAQTKSKQSQCMMLRAVEDHVEDYPRVASQDQISRLIAYAFKIQADEPSKTSFPENMERSSVYMTLYAYANYNGKLFTQKHVNDIAQMVLSETNIYSGIVIEKLFKKIMDVRRDLIVQEVLSETKAITVGKYLMVAADTIRKNAEGRTQPVDTLTLKKIADLNSKRKPDTISEELQTFLQEQCTLHKDYADRELFNAIACISVRSANPNVRDIAYNTFDMLLGYDETLATKKLEKELSSEKISNTHDRLVAVCPNLLPRPSAKERLGGYFRRFGLS